MFETIKCKKLLFTKIIKYKNNTEKTWNIMKEVVSKKNSYQNFFYLAKL